MVEKCVASIHDNFLLPKNHYEKVIGSIPCGYGSFTVIRDKAGNPEDFVFIDINAAAEKVLGMAKEDIVGKGLRKIYNTLEGIVLDVFEHLQCCANTGKPVTFTQYSQKREAWLKISMFHTGDDCITVVLSDINISMIPFSDLDIFFNITPNLLSISRTDGKYIRVNPAWEKILGYSPSEITGRYSWEFVHPEDLSQDNTISQQLQSRSRILNFVNRYRHKNGAYHYLEWDVQSDGEKIYAVAKDITERQLWKEKIEYLSYHDTLTGLFNRRFMEEEIRRLDTARNLPISIIMGDLNRLKLINDAFGHEKGDEFIQKAADAMRTSCRPEDLIARWGGDEFVIFLPKITLYEAERIAQRIQNHCKEMLVNSIAVDIAFGIGNKSDADMPILDVMREAENNMYKAKARDSERTRNDIVDAVINTLYQRNPYEERHAKRVSALCGRIAEAMELEEEHIRKISIAGMMHDIGKVAVSIQILDKPSKLTEEEWQEVKKHAEIGCKVVGSAQDMVDVGNAILAHHERMDGKGYPKGIKLDDIPLAARIITIADSYDTMTSPSPYHIPLSMDAAIEELRRNEGTQFDPDIAEIFIRKVLVKIT